MIRSLRLILSLALLLPMLSCEREAPASPSRGALVLLQPGTKSPGAGEYTCRAALLDLSTGAFIAQGSYCSLLIDHSASVPGGRWLSPCRVDGAGRALKADGTPAASLAEADRDSAYGLRAYNGSCYLVAASPAAAFSPDGSLRYYAWTPGTELYLSDPVPATLSGSWLDGEYVYASAAALTLRDRRASLCIRIECGELSEAYIQRVTLRNRVTDGRWYLATGFSNDHFTAEDVVLYDCGGSPMHLLRAGGDSWNSAALMIPAIDYHAAAFAALRPQIEILLGNDPAHPARALVDITETAAPMTDYSYLLRISKSQVVISLAAGAWDDGGSVSSDDSERPGVIGTVGIAGWAENDGDTDTDDWNDHF